MPIGFRAVQGEAAGDRRFTMPRISNNTWNYQEKRFVRNTVVVVLIGATSSPPKGIAVDELNRDLLVAVLAVLTDAIPRPELAAALKSWSEESGPAAGGGAQGGDRPR